MKLLYWDGQRFCLYYKVLERGHFPWPNAKDGAVRMTSAQLAMLWAPLAHAGMRCRATDDPATLKAMIAALQAENAKISATLRVHDQLVQALRLRIAKLQKLAFGKSSEKIEREIEQLELALEDLLVAVAEDDSAPIDEGSNEPIPEAADAPVLRRRPRVSDVTPRERRELDPGTCCPDCGGDLRVVGEDVSELLDMIAAQMKVIQIARIKKSCRRCERMVQEPAPSRPIPGSMAPLGHVNMPCRAVGPKPVSPRSSVEVR
jgi:transposase